MSELSQGGNLRTATLRVALGRAEKGGRGKLRLQEWVAVREVCSPPTDLVERVAVKIPLYSKTVSV